jgi:hypothetical protein
MTNEATIDLSGFRRENWCAVDSAPPVVMNPEATLHACVAWAWGEVYEANQLLAAAMPVVPVSPQMQLDTVVSRLMGAVAMLEALAEATSKDARTVANIRRQLPLPEFNHQPSGVHQSNRPRGA